MAYRFSSTFSGSRYFLNNMYYTIKNAYRSGRDPKERGHNFREGPRDLELHRLIK